MSKKNWENGHWEKKIKECPNLFCRVGHSQRKNYICPKMKKILDALKKNPAYVQKPEAGTDIVKEKFVYVQWDKKRTRII